MRPDVIDWGKLGKCHITPMYINIRLFNVLKIIGWRNWWKIRRIRRARVLKNKWTVESEYDLQVLHGIDIEKELKDALQREVENEQTIGTNDK